jgi:hypothetical protein
MRSKFGANVLNMADSLRIDKATCEVDITRIMRPTIEAKNAYYREIGSEVESKFLGLPTDAISLEDLLMSDVDWIFSNQAGLSSHPAVNDLQVVEVPCRRIRRFSDQSPSDSRSGETSPETCRHKILFQTPLLHLTHAFFSKAELLICDDRIQQCVPMDDQLVEKEEYSDVYLLHGIFKDLYDVFVADEAYVPLQPRHFIDAYNFTERVVGARRFLVAREIAANQVSNLPVEDWFRESVDLQGDDLRDAWIEFNGDQIAARFITNHYPPDKLPPDSLYEFENCLVGIQFFLGMLDIAFMACGDFARERISLLRPAERLAGVRKQFAQSAVLRANPQVAGVMAHKAEGIAALKRVLAGEATLQEVNMKLRLRMILDPSVGSLWSAYRDQYVAG